MWSIHATEYYLIIKNNNILTYTAMSMKLGNIMLNETPVTKTTYYMIPFI